MGPRRLGDGLVQPAPEERAVGQVGEGVVFGEILVPAFAFLGFRQGDFELGVGVGQFPGLEHFRVKLNHLTGMIFPQG